VVTINLPLTEKNDFDRAEILAQDEFVLRLLGCLA
jgi:hypothetical protein